MQEPFVCNEASSRSYFMPLKLRLCAESYCVFSDMYVYPLTISGLLQSKCHFSIALPNQMNLFLLGKTHHNGLPKQAANESSLGLTNKDQPCYDLTLTPAPSTLPEGSSRGKICKDPDSHVFWDE